MIGWLHGSVRARTDDKLIVAVGGVGYVVHVPLGAGAHLELEAEIDLHVHTHVREDSLQLFGFETSAALETFETLIKVSGVGPRLAQAILGSLDTDALAAAIDLGDIAALKKVPGVGKRVAERLSLELRGKLRSGASAIDGAPIAHRLAAGGVWRDLESALMN
ncbi:MAG: Holliday junction branch migration protein RuvA, partial [Myxococcota bacterium]|nr:Holliday junction branch migration protein RuvA [Myxococcota bacterium]